MSSLVKIGLGVVFLLGALLSTAGYALFRGYFDHGLFEIKQVEWSPSPSRRVAVVAERSEIGLRWISRRPQSHKRAVGRPEELGPVRVDSTLNRRQHMLASMTVLGVLVVLSLIAVGVARHPASAQGAGSGLLRMDIALLLAYGIAGVWVWFERRPEVNLSMRIGARLGVLLGAVHVANHVVESYVPHRPFVLIISPVFLMLALFGAAGSTAWQRTRSLGLSVIAGVWCAITGILITVCVVFSVSLAFEGNAELQMHEAFAASGMNDPGAFLVRNMLEATSEGLVRMPIFAVFLSFIGAITNAWISGASRRPALVAAFLTPLMFGVGATALWHADSLERAARPPFVMTGVALAGLALCGAHPTWSALRRARQRS